MYCDIGSGAWELLEPPGNLNIYGLVPVTFPDNPAVTQLPAKMIQHFHIHVHNHAYMYEEQECGPH